MSRELVVVYSHEEPPAGCDASVFLAGPPTPDARRRNYLTHYAGNQAVLTALTLPATIGAALAEIGHGARRTGGQRHVPLLLWRTASFQRWYCAQAAAWNSLLSARVVWTF